MQSNYPEQLTQKMKDYYKSYYLNDLALHDWEKRFNNNRINEEIILGKRLFDVLKSRGFDLTGKKIMILGAGTGAEGFYLRAHCSADITFVEPSEKAIEILKEKASFFQVSESKIFCAVGEALPSVDSVFDYVICYTVLEHVQDVGKTLQEIHRVIKKSGAGIIITPNYNYPEEPHYKIKTFPPAYLSVLTKLHLKLINRYTPFFETLNFITISKVNKILNERNIPYKNLDDLFPPENVGVVGFFVKLFKIQRNQFILIKKD